MARPISVKTRANVITALKAVIPEALSRNGIVEITGVHVNTLDQLLKEFLEKKWIEAIIIRGNGIVFRWIKSK